MKPTLILLLTISFFAKAQDWSLIHNNLTTYYKYKDNILVLKPSGIVDSIYFNTYAKLGEHWRSSSRSSGDYTATITGIGIEYFLGISDSVKIIQMSFNNTLAGVFKLSKNYGMIKTYTFNCFPNMESVTLTGIQNIAGFQDFGKDIYNFNIGDEFQIRQDRLSRGDSYLRYIDRKILNKSQTSTTFTYQIQDIFCRSSFTNSTNFSCNTIDTNVYSKTYSKTDNNGFLIPSSPKCNNQKYFDKSFTLDSNSKSIVTDVLDNYIVYTYKKGVGLSYREFSGPGGSSGEAVLYYKNKNETVGVKMNFILTNLNDKLALTSYKIASNPSHGLFTFYNQENSTVDLSIHNAVGQEVWKQNNIRIQATEINLIGNPAGIYQLRITSIGIKPTVLKIVLQ